MAAETLVIALVLFAGLWMLVFGVEGASGRRGNVVALGLVSAAVATALTILGNDWRPIPEREVRGRPIKVAKDGYVTSNTCRACHPGEYASWHASYHRTMTQVATEASVAGDFENLDPRLRDHLVRHGTEFFVRFGGPNDLLAREHRIVMTTGSHHYQAYWYEAGQGRRLQLVPAVYLIDQQRWIPRDAAFLTPPQTSAATLIGEWNANCIKCHSVHGQPRVSDPMARSTDVRLDTHVAEFGIACEACHGPADAHVSANVDPVGRYRHHWSDEADSTVIQPERLDHRQSSAVCGQCHSIFELPDNEAILKYAQEGFDYRPGGDLNQTRLVVRPHVNGDSATMREILDANPEYYAQRYWSDGMVRVSGREYNGLIESPCYQRGEMSCLSCHEMHKSADDPRPLKEWANDQLKPAMETNQACLQCHDEFAEHIEDHTHHAAESTGSLCYNCHMPYTTYGLLKAIRSHQIDSPSVQNTLATGRPNACNLCHLNETLSWTADHLTRWYDMPAVEVDDDERSVAASLLWILRGNAGQRALVAWNMGWNSAQEASESSWIPPYLALLLDDPYDAVRFIAYRSLRSLPGFAAFEFDFMSPLPDRAAAKQRALELWQHRRGAKPVNEGSKILLHDDGSMRQTEIERLLNKRDTHPVNLAE